MGIVLLKWSDAQCKVNGSTGHTTMPNCGVRSATDTLVTRFAASQPYFFPQNNRIDIHTKLTIYLLLSRAILAYVARACWSLLSTTNKCRLEEFNLEHSIPLRGSCSFSETTNSPEAYGQLTLRPTPSSRLPLPHVSWSVMLSRLKSGEK